jgi:hypothetical protein
MERKDTSCILWEKARVKGQDKGFIMAEKCPVVNSCKETKCPFLESGEIYPRNDFMLKQLRLELKGMDSNK